MRQASGENFYLVFLDILFSCMKIVFFLAYSIGD